MNRFIDDEKKKNEVDQEDGNRDLMPQIQGEKNI